jgi:hypothetical protein
VGGADAEAAEVAQLLNTRQPQPQSPASQQPHSPAAPRQLDGTGTGGGYSFQSATLARTQQMQSQRQGGGTSPERDEEAAYERYKLRQFFSFSMPLI